VEPRLYLLCPPRHRSN